MSTTRGQWGSRLGFILAAAGSAIGLGNIWKFPYITGENGGGAFVIIYLCCIALVGLPILLGEILIGRMAQTSPVGAFQKLARPKSPWMGVGFLGVIASVVVLSYYSVVAGWAIHYTVGSVTGSVLNADIAQSKAAFGALYENGMLNVIYHSAFMFATALIVIGGIQKGVERASRVLMPTLFIFLIILAIYASRLSGFPKAFNFVFGFHTHDLKPAGVLEALGHSFFSLSVGMGAMLTYGSYLSKHDDIVAASIATTVLDTLVALLACVILFPITFTAGIAPSSGPGLVFINMPVALAGLPGGALLATVFFVLLVFAAITSSISMLEVICAYFIDEKGWSRKKAVITTSIFIFLLGIPSALSGGKGFFGAGVTQIVGKNWFDAFDYLASNWMLPLGGLGIALFAGYRIDAAARAADFADGSRLGKLLFVYMGWLQLIRFVAPIAILFIILHAIGVV
ncbi:MAG: sodium-dependent transporter [Polyangiaceae bacterium]|nr:sodium-dependent transporter [Polyangiaceae bacterium]